MKFLFLNATIIRLVTVILWFSGANAIQAALVHETIREQAGTNLVKLP